MADSEEKAEEHAQKVIGLGGGGIGLDGSGLRLGCVGGGLGDGDLSRLKDMLGLFSLEHRARRSLAPAPRDKPGAHERQQHDGGLHVAHQRLEHRVGQDARHRDVAHERQVDAREDLLDDERPAKLQAADDGERLQVAHEDHD